MRLYETALAKFQQKIKKFGKKKMEKQKAMLQKVSRENVKKI